ncbi:MAG: hypothetical protein AAGA96_07030 [Verrucomicrobiota bacterium]
MVIRSSLTPLILLLFAVSSALAQGDSKNPDGFHFGFIPGATPETYGDDPAPQTLSGFHFGYQSEDDGSDTQWYSNVNVTEYQTLMGVGISSVLYEQNSFIVSGHALGGYALGHKNFHDSWHGSFDLYAAHPLGSSGSHFIKYGGFVDVEDNFGKAGPEIALFLNADKKHPITLDVAYGRGFGDEFQHHNFVWSVAEDDLQFRAGVFLNPRLQLGVTGQYQRWDDILGIEEDWKTGGFISWFSGKGLSLSLGMATGSLGSNGFASVSFQRRARAPVPFSGKSVVGAKQVVPEPELPRNWMTRPVSRLNTVSVRQLTNHQVAHQTNLPVSGQVVGRFSFAGDPNTVGNIGGTNNRLEVIYTNTSGLPQAVTIVSFENFDQSTISTPNLSATVNAGSTLSPGPGPPVTAMGGAPYIQTVVVEVNGRSFSVDLVFPASTPNNGFSAPVTVGP